MTVALQPSTAASQATSFVIPSRCSDSSKLLLPRLDLLIEGANVVLFAGKDRDDQAGVIHSCFLSLAKNSEERRCA
jgi:hypothetical protein